MAQPPGQSDPGILVKVLLLIPIATNQNPLVQPLTTHSDILIHTNYSIYYYGQIGYH